MSEGPSGIGFHSTWSCGGYSKTDTEVLNTDMNDPIGQLAIDVAAVIPTVDQQTEGQYGAGIGSEDEPRQVALIASALRKHSPDYDDLRLEVPYPVSGGSCDLVLPGGIPVECKLLRYWRANGDPEDSMPRQVLSPFHSNTLLSDAAKLARSGFEDPGGLLGLFYVRNAADPVSIRMLAERYTATELAEKTALDIRYWFDIEVEVCAVAPFDGLRHPVQARGAAITWRLRR